MASTAFFNTPRGRWWMKALCELAFLALFQITAFDLLPTNSVHRYRHLALWLFCAGNLLEAGQVRQHAIIVLIHLFLY